jgi:uncharacterized protein YkwD
MKKSFKKKRQYNRSVNLKEFIFVLAAFLIIQTACLIYNENIYKGVVLGVNKIATVVSSILVLQTNDFRSANDEEGLIVSDLLTKAAQMKAEDMAAKGYFSHTGPMGEEPWTWFDKVNYKYSYAGENLAVDYTESSDVTQGWINSATHKANLLNKNFTEIGVGVAEGTFQGHKSIFVVQFFAKPFVPKTIEETKVIINKKDLIVDDEIITSHTTKINSVNPLVAVATTPDLPTGEVLGIKNNNSVENNNLITENIKRGFWGKIFHPIQTIREAFYE